MTKKTDLKCNTCAGTNSEFVFSNRIESTSRMENVPRDVYICKDCGQVYLDISNITGYSIGEMHERGSDISGLKTLRTIIDGKVTPLKVRNLN